LENCLEYLPKLLNNFEITADWDYSDWDSPYEAKGYFIYKFYTKKYEVCLTKVIYVNINREYLYFFEYNDEKDYHI